MKKYIILLTLLYTTTAHAGIVEVAQSNIGKGEVGGNNKGAFVKLVNKGLEASWCAGFVSYTLKEAGITTLKYNLSAKAIYNEAKSKNMLTKEPKAGNLICFWRGKKNGWQGHIGIIESVDNEYIYTIEGNVGNYPAKVAKYKYARNDIPKLLGFVEVK